MYKFNLLLVVALTAIAFCFIRCASHNSSSKNIAGGAYQCMPCGYDCDTLSFNGPGKCPHCKMELVKKATVNIPNIQPSDLCGYIATHPKSILLDVRTKEEFEGKGNPDFGTLKNAINIPVQNLPARIKELETYKTSQIIVYCSHSHRSKVASYLLTQNGFTKVINMAGGISELKEGDCKK